ncbi:hypothetical protein BLOT_012722 [Blomia tropicalis]|nr:hypothetical protein BLOT_012722 [Blomia tropicalis]
MKNILLVIFNVVIVVVVIGNHSIQSQRISRLWATRLNSKMVRIKDDDMSNDNGRIILRRATQFDDAPESNVFDDRIQSASTINDDRQFLKRNGRFDDQFNSRSKPIWNYFDHGINRPEQSSSFNQPWRSTNNNGFIGNGIGSARIRELPTQSDDYISQQFAKRLNGGGGGGSSSIRPSTLSPLISPFQSKVKATPTTPTSTSQSNGKKSDVFNFNFQNSRKKNPEEKERWRQLIQSIFDSSPRTTPDYIGTRITTKSKFSEPIGGGGAGGSVTSFNYGSGKSTSKKSGPIETIKTINSIDDRTKDDDESPVTVEEDEDVLSGEKEENVVLKDIPEKTSEEEDEEDENENRSTKLSPEEFANTSSEEDSNGSNVSSNRKRNAGSSDDEAVDNITQEDEDTEDELADDNQYLRPNRHNKSIANVGTGSAKRSINSGDSSSFGVRINRSNPTGNGLQSPARRALNQNDLKLIHGAKPITEPITDQMIADLTNDPNFSGPISGTNNNFDLGIISTTQPSIVTSTNDILRSPSTERSSSDLDMVDDDDDSEESLFERSQTVTTSRPLAITTPTTTSSSIVESGTNIPLKSIKRTNFGKRTRTGKWMDSETFQLNDDRSMVMLDEDDDDDIVMGDIERSSNDISTRRRGRHANRPMPINRPKQVTKRRLINGGHHHPQPRIVRQDSHHHQRSNQNDGINRLAAALPGTPGTDYPIYGLIPRTSFNCRDHKWAGYYADVETQCQVFHICQTGGRKNSFLCPNGTMFNQQLFICDWWHNVQCDEVPAHYELNANIYDYQWESKRMKKAAVMLPPDEIDQDELDHNELIRRVGLVQRSIQSNNGRRSSQQNKILTGSSINNLGVKGGKLVKFNRIMTKPKLSSGTTSTAQTSFFNRFKYASNEFPKSQPLKQISSSPSSSSSSAAATAAAIINTFRNNRNPFSSTSSSSQFRSHPQSSSNFPSFTSALSSSSLHSGSRGKHYRA